MFVACCPRAAASYLSCCQGGWGARPFRKPQVASWHLYIGRFSMRTHWSHVSLSASRLLKSRSIQRARNSRWRRSARDSSIAHEIDNPIIGCCQHHAIHPSSSLVLSCATAAHPHLNRAFLATPHVGHSLLLSSSHYANRSGFDRLSSRRAERRGAHWAAGV